MRCYETMFILKPTLTAEEISAKIEFFKGILTGNGASIEGVIDMGMRNLAYEIKKCKRGYYFVIYFKAAPNLVAELERNYRINEDIIRFIVINYKTKTEQKNWGVLVDKANGKYVEPQRKKRSESGEKSPIDSTKSAEFSGDSSESAESADSNA